MEFAEAAKMIGPGVSTAGGTWTDLGAGEGFFTRVLAHLVGPSGNVIAIDRDIGSVSTLQSLSEDSKDGHASIVAAHGDFLNINVLAALDGVQLDGALFANALHYAPDPAAVLSAVRGKLKESGCIILVEYDRSLANQWVPFPLPFDRLRPLAARVGLAQPEMLYRRRSQFGGAMYSALVRMKPAASCGGINGEDSNGV